MSGLWTNDRDTLADALVGYLAGIRALAEGTKNDEPAARFWAPRVAADLIDKGTVRVLDPDNTELVEQVAGTLYGGDWERARRNARAVLMTLRQP
jgi:hypothetical protein